MTRGGKNYFVTFIDDYSRYTKVYLIFRKGKTNSNHQIAQSFRLILEAMERGIGCDGDGRKSTAFRTLKPTWVVIFLQIYFFCISSFKRWLFFECWKQATSCFSSDLNDHFQTLSLQYRRWGQLLRVSGGGRFLHFSFPLAPIL